MLLLTLVTWLTCLALVPYDVGKKALEDMTDKRSKKYTTVTKPSYRDYFSSNVTLREAHKAGIVIKRYMVRICFSKMELTYYETKYHFLRDVLEKEST